MKGKPKRKPKKPLRARGIRDSLVILVWNEIEAIKKLYPMIPFDSVDETIVIDGGSDDGTAEFLKGKGLRIFSQKEKGRGNAFREGLRRAKGENLVFFSGDGNEDPRDVPKIVKQLNKGYDLVIAGRFVLKGSKSDDSDDPLRIRKSSCIMLGLLVRMIWGGGIWDTINGFRGMKRGAMVRMGLDAPKHEIEFQSSIRALKLGMKVKEIPTKELLRLGGLRKPTAGTWTLAKAFFTFFLKELAAGKGFARTAKS